MRFNCAGRCALILFIGINSVFILLGLGLLIVGILMKVYSDVIDKTEVTSLLNEVSFNGNLRLGFVVSSLSIFAISLGGFISIIAAICTFGRCCRRRCMLVTYALILILLLAIEIISVGLLVTVKDRIENNVKGELETVLTKYEGPTSMVKVSMGWDFMFLGYDCCGIEDVGTYNREEFKDSVWYTNRDTKEIPLSCCKVATEVTYKYSLDPSCTDGHYIAANSKGCHQAFKDWLYTFLTPMIAIEIVLLLPEMLIIVFAFIMCRAVGKEERVV